MWGTGGSVPIEMRGKIQTPKDGSCRRSIQRMDIKALTSAAFVSFNLLTLFCRTFQSICLKDGGVKTAAKKNCLTESKA